MCAGIPTNSEHSLSHNRNGASPRPLSRTITLTRPIIKKFPVTSRGHARYVHPSKRTVNCNNFSSSLTVVTVKAPLVKSSMHVDWDSTVAVLILRKGLVEAFNLQVIRTEANVE
ncbi:PREDICTED: uncharacterized protein LOC109147759 [Ipomoea nil]|uniref:uncharacterized protein LOC109147759 n=1 Tax=Ipomoea nil TaxID=35883 RepID=UPI000901EC3A|nr:PREDICTED: uncharacterized protein LOC109147759 [Ipomoea nil]